MIQKLKLKKGHHSTVAKERRFAQIAFDSIAYAGNVGVIIKPFSLLEIDRMINHTSRKVRIFPQPGEPTRL